MKNRNRKNRRTFKGRGHVTKTKQLQTEEYPKATQQSYCSFPLTPPNTLLFSGASPCASVLPYLYIYLTSC